MFFDSYYETSREKVARYFEKKADAALLQSDWDSVDYWRELAHEARSGAFDPDVYPSDECAECEEVNAEAGSHITKARLSLALIRNLKSKTTRHRRNLDDLEYRIEAILDFLESL